jgi:hypothetical protein
MTHMEAALVFMLFRLCFFLASLPSCAASQNFVVPWSTQKFGPDGPWQAVNIRVGGNNSARVIEVQKIADLSVYPGGEFTSMTIAPSACRNFSSPCGSGGTWEPDQYQRDQQFVSWPASWIDNATGIHIEDAQVIVLGLTINTTTVYNATLASASSGNVTYPDKNVGGVTLGYLALGADERRQIFTIGTGPSDGINASLFSGQLYDSGAIPSYSYGLHIGSAAFNYPGSLVFGGYNKGRVIGPITAFSDQNAVDLIDISIGVASGSSPFTFTSKDKLLSTGQTTVSPDPLSPYIYLPRKTCDNIVSALPAYFDEGLQYYLWNTTNPNFTKIVSSPAYLGFTFPHGPGDTDNVVIKVPFALLNLTLDTPITDTPVQYFPCLPYDSTPKLGRAFLQAAFIGRNWNTRTSWLAQAPGPGARRQGLNDQNIDIPDGAVMIDGYPGADLFTKSWSGQWSLAESLVFEGTSSTSDGLSTGAKAGIGIGAALGAISLLAASIFFLRSRFTKNKFAAAHHHPREMTKDGHAQQGYGSWIGNRPVGELPDAQQGSAAELPPGEQDLSVELPHTQQDPVELGDTSTRNSR